MPAFTSIINDMKNGKPYDEGEFRIKSSNGLYLWYRIRTTAQFDRLGHAVTAVGVILDINAEKEEK